jgi:hypothetical protein
MRTLDESFWPANGRDHDEILICLAAAGLDDLAREVKADSLRARKCLRWGDRLRMEWLECRIAVHLGDLEEAIPRLEAIYRQLGTSNLVRSCLCALDVAYAYARAGLLEERLPALLRDVATQPRAAEEVWALGALWKFREAVLEAGLPPAVAAREAAALIYRCERSLSFLAAPRGKPAASRGSLQRGRGSRRRSAGADSAAREDAGAPAATYGATP